MSYPDYEAVDRLVLDTLAAAGFVFTDKAGERQIDHDALREAVYRKMVDEHVVTDPKLVAKGAVTRRELYGAVLPNGPGAGRQPATEVEALAREQLERQLWNFTNTGVTGYVNRRVEVEDLSLIMCEAGVGRTNRSEETGRITATTDKQPAIR